MKQQYLWARFGDCSDYEQTTMGDVIERLKEYGITKVKKYSSGITDDNQFAGDNYISLYYGNKDGTALISYVTDNEIQLINSLLEE